MVLESSLLKKSQTADLKTLGVVFFGGFFHKILLTEYGGFKAGCETMSV